MTETLQCLDIQERSEARELSCMVSWMGENQEIGCLGSREKRISQSTLLNVADGWNKMESPDHWALQLRDCQEPLDNSSLSGVQLENVAG